MNTQEEVFCPYCKKVFYIKGYKFTEAKTLSCLYCKKRIENKTKKQLKDEVGK